MNNEELWILTARLTWTDIGVIYWCVLAGCVLAGYSWAQNAWPCAPLLTRCSKRIFPCEVGNSRQISVGQVCQYMLHKLGLKLSGFTITFFFLIAGFIFQSDLYLFENKYWQWNAGLVSWTKILFFVAVHLKSVAVVVSTGS